MGGEKERRRGGAKGKEEKGRKGEQGEGREHLKDVCEKNSTFPCLCVHVYVFVYVKEFCKCACVKCLVKTPILDRKGALLVLEACESQIVCL